MITAIAVSFVVLFFISSKREIEMRTIQSVVIEKGLKHADRDVMKNKQVNISDKKKGTLTRIEIEDLMGCNRETYERSVKRR